MTNQTDTLIAKLESLAAKEMPCPNSEDTYNGCRIHDVPDAMGCADCNGDKTVKPFEDATTVEVLCSALNGPGRPSHSQDAANCDRCKGEPPGRVLRESRAEILGLLLAASSRVFVDVYIDFGVSPKLYANIGSKEYSVAHDSSADSMLEALADALDQVVKDNADA